jgi:hypothetical protein
MKQKDIALVLVIGFFSLILSLILSNVLFNTAKDKKLQSAVVEPITTEFTTPDEKYFNKDSINPTQKITINENNNDKPFNP